MKKPRNLLSNLIWITNGGIALGIISIMILTAVSTPSIPRVPEKLDRLITVPPTQIFAADGSLLTQVGGRKAIPFSRISPNFKQSVLATEDDGFYEHPGIDKPALIKATVGAVTGNRSRGGSTITQQLAKNLFFTFKKSTTRKFKEILASFEIEDRFTKDEILSAYCNGIYFGGGAFGVEEAALYYYGKHANNLSLSEASLLAGIPNSPARYNPYRHPERAAGRQHHILNRLFSLGWIDKDVFQKAMLDSLEFKQLYQQADDGSFFIDALLQQVEEEYGASVLYHGGLKIYSTLDPVLQDYAVDAVKKSLQDLDEKFGLEDFSTSTKDNRGEYPQGNIVAVDVASGAIKALVGGRDYNASQFNRALANNRSIGSSAKPVLYLTAIEKLGYSPATVVVDSPIVIEIAGAADWEPENFERYFRGPLVIKAALEHSINTVAARLIQRTTPESMVETFKRFGITTDIRPNYSNALGAISLSTVEMAGIVATIANKGAVSKPYLISRIEDSQNNILEEHLVAPKQQFNQEDMYLLIDMMKGVVKSGTGKSVRRYGFDRPAIGKTGTTNDYRDSWFIGATPKLAACAWVGFDDNRKMVIPQVGTITGANGGLPIWARFMTKATEGEPVQDFTKPPGIDIKRVNIQDGSEHSALSTERIDVAVKHGTVLEKTRIDSFWIKNYNGVTKEEIEYWADTITDTTAIDSTITSGGDSL